MADEDLKRHLDRMKGDPEYGGTRHPDQTADRWTFEGFAEACEQIVHSLLDRPESMHALYPVLLRYIKQEKDRQDIRQFREDVRGIWENRCGESKNPR